MDIHYIYVHTYTHCVPHILSCNRVTQSANVNAQNFTSAML